MFPALILLLLTNLIYFGHGFPLELEPQYDMKQFLSSRIVGGKPAPPEYGHSNVALVFGDTGTFLMCGGSIITKSHILSAAHCIEPMVVWGQLVPSFRAVIGSNKWASTEKNVRFKGFVTHNGFSWMTLKNDIGVLQLAINIKLGPNVAIIPLNFDRVDGGESAYVTGWGRLGTSLNIPDKLQLLYVKTITGKQCIKALEAAASDGWGSIPPHDPKIEICTFHSVGHGMCNGDSGSALVQESSQKQIGIVSWGMPCARGSPDVFVRISGFKTWIKETLGPEFDI